MESVGAAANPHWTLVVNALGHLAGLSLFALFLYLMRSGHRRNPAPNFGLAAAAAAGAMLWNAGSLLVFLTPEKATGLRDAAADLSFAVFSLLPAVLLHLSLGARRPLLRVIGYLLGTAAVAAYLIEPAHRIGLGLITYGFSALAILAAVLPDRDRDKGRGAALRAPAAIALVLFAASFAHFAPGHGPAAWTHELIFHHAGIPLALFILLENHRFLLLDVFVRFLGGGLIAAVLAGVVLAAADAAEWVELDAADPASLTALAATLIGALLLYPVLHERVRGGLERFAFGRGDVEKAVRAVQNLSMTNDRDEDFLEAAAAEIATFAKARRWSLAELDGPWSGPRRTRLPNDRLFESIREGWAEAAVPLGTDLAPRRVLLLGGRVAGGPYLSGDVDDLDALAEATAAEMESRRRRELQKLAAAAELNALRAQINPHFLFNALNALYGTIPRTAAEARGAVLSLADIFRYSLHGDRQFASLDEELKIVEAYLRIERLRLGPRLRTEILVDEEARGVSVPVLSIQPLVENAVKHGAAARAEGGAVTVEARLREGSLAVEVRDDGPGFDAAKPAVNGRGLENVERRLRLCFGDRSDFKIESSAAGTRARVLLPVGDAPAAVHS